MDYWMVGLGIYSVVLIISFLPSLRAIFRKVRLNPGGSSFEDCAHFNDTEKVLLTQHYSRIQGTLVMSCLRVRRLNELGIQIV